MAVGVRGAVKRFAGTPAVDGVDLDIGPGEFVAVVGPSGCGKSTLLRLIAGLETLDAGRIDLDGRTVSAPGVHVAPEARGVGVVFQSYALWPHMSVAENVAFPAEAAGAGRGAARDAALVHLGTVGLAALAGRRPAELSGGQRQRVALARCLAQRARVILMDEPLASLDPHLRAAMEEELAAFQARTGAAALYITHDQREAFAVAHRVAVMAAGRILQADAPETVYARPASEAVARFIGRGAVLPVQVAGGTADLGPVAVPAAGRAGDPAAARLLVRPEEVRLAADGPLGGQVTAALYRGGVWEGSVRVDGLAEPLAVSSPSRIAAGQEVRLAVTGGWLLPG
ncbi:MAG: ABC transporter ATP-binding protein [Rhodobacteraceae bacterium]|jgi:iron(III) transport system ATP-binding protein|nr:ABC transporter ATP-binding protein [Paracoccaceae bacterium]